jgi:sarcosine oxidase subunit beta
MNKSNIYDVIVIGSGSIGTPTAFCLARAGLKTLVIDAAPSVGQGSNKKAIGGVRATHSDPAKIHLCMRSLEILSTWEEVYGDDIEWTRGGYCFVAYRAQEEKSLKALAVQQKALGLNIDWLDAGPLLEAVPSLNPEGLLGGTLSPDDGNASPLLTIHAYYDHAVASGAEFHFKEPIREILCQHDRVQGIRTDRESYSAPVVINATGAWAKEVAALAHVSVPVTPDCHEAAVTEPVAPFLKPMVVDIEPGPGSANFYFYQHATGQIIFCITPSPNIWGFNTEETSQFLPMVAPRLIKVMPRLKNIRVRRTWRGLYPMTPDGFPIVGWAGQPEGFLLAVGMCGQGFMLGPATGELITRMVLQQLTREDEQTLEYLSPIRKFGGQELLG